MTETNDIIKSAIDREFLNPSKRRSHYLERISIVNSLKKVRHLVKPWIILDVGCGMKPYKSLLNTSDSTYYGTDYPITMDGSYGKSTNADFFSESTLLPFNNNTFDTFAPIHDVNDNVDNSLDDNNNKSFDSKCSPPLSKRWFWQIRWENKFQSVCSFRSYHWTYFDRINQGAN